MKKLILSIMTLVGFLSCTTVRFENPQPVDSQQLAEFPLQMQGLFISEEDDTLEVSTYKFSYRNGEDMNITGDLLSQETVLKEFGDYYILNIKDEGVWDVFPLKVRKNRLIAYYSSLESDVEDLMEELKKTSVVKEIPDTNDQLGYYLVSPSKKEFEFLFEKNLFSEKLTFKRSSGK